MWKMKTFLCIPLFFVSSYCQRSSADSINIANNADSKNPPVHAILFVNTGFPWIGQLGAYVIPVRHLYVRGTASTVIWIYNADIAIGYQWAVGEKDWFKMDIGYCYQYGALPAVESSSDHVNGSGSTFHIGGSHFITNTFGMHISLGFYNVKGQEMPSFNIGVFFSCL
jgi:hypothetical protein